MYPSHLGRLPDAATLDSYDEDADLTEVAPLIESPDQLQSLIGLSIVHVLADAKDGMSYVGFEFGCTWEGEHGLGVMTHGDRVIHVGAAEQAFRL